MAKRDRSSSCCNRADAVPAPAAKRQQHARLSTTPPYTNSVSPPTYHHLDNGTSGTLLPLTALSSLKPNWHSTSSQPITDPSVEQLNVNLRSVSPSLQDSYQTSQDNYDSGTQLVAPPNPDDLRRGLARSPIMSSSITNAFFAPYDPDFGAKVQAHMRFYDERRAIRQMLRVNKYGSEVAEQWRCGHTPVDIREGYWEEQDRRMQEYLLSDPDTDSEDMIAPSDVKVEKNKVRGGIVEGGRVSKGIDEAGKGDDAIHVPNAPRMLDGAHITDNAKIGDVRPVHSRRIYKEVAKRKVEELERTRP